MEFNNNFLWVENYRYVKCPICGKVAVIDIGKILTSMPPKYQWHCKHCNGYGYLLCDEISKFEAVTPTQEDKDLYDPQPKYETGSTESITVSDGEEAQPIIINLAKENNLRITGTCEICGKSFDAGPAVSTGFSEPTRHICHECADKLKKLVDFIK